MTVVMMLMKQFSGSPEKVLRKEDMGSEAKTVAGHETGEPVLFSITGGVNPLKQM